MATLAVLPGHREFRLILAVYIFCSLAFLTSSAQDLPNSKDPAGMKRYQSAEPLSRTGAVVVAVVFKESFGELNH